MTIRSLALAGAVAALLAGCATTPPGASPSPAATVSGQPTATTATTITEDTVDARNDAARAAIEAAENAGAGRAIDLTWTDDGWRIDVVAGDAERDEPMSGKGGGQLVRQRTKRSGLEVAVLTGAVEIVENRQQLLDDELLAQRHF